MVRLIPRDEAFTEIFIRDGENLLAAARALEGMVVTFDRLDERVAAIQALEHEGDEIDTEIATRLERAFITPFDREDIHELTSRLDDVVDGIQEVAETFVIYGIEKPTPEARQLAGIIAGQGAELLAALRLLDKPETMQAHLRSVHTLENEADGPVLVVGHSFGGDRAALPRADGPPRRDPVPRPVYRPGGDDRRGRGRRRDPGADRCQGRLSVARRAARHASSNATRSPHGGGVSSADSAMMPSPSRSHCTPAPATNTEPSTA